MEKHPMKTSQSPASDSAGSAPPTLEAARKPLTASVSATRRAIVRHVVRGAVDTYNEALRARAEAEAAFADDEECDPMMDVVNDRVEDARMTLLRAILSVSPEGLPAPGCGAEMRLGSPRGVSLDGRLYLVHPDPTEAEGMKLGDVIGGSATRPVMVLTIVDRSAVEDMDGTPIHDLDAVG
jgi:hypothetical protein